MTLTFAENLGVNVLLLPMGRGDDGAQCVSVRLPRLTRRLTDLLTPCSSSTNEKLDMSNFIQGVSVSFSDALVLPLAYGDVFFSHTDQTKLLGTYLYEVADITASA